MYVIVFGGIAIPSMFKRLNQIMQEGDIMNDEMFRGLIRKYMELRHVRRLEDIRQHTTLSKGTFSKYWNEPCLYPLGQVIAMFNYLKIPYEERSQVLNQK